MCYNVCSKVDTGTQSATPTNNTWTCLAVNFTQDKLSTVPLVCPLKLMLLELTHTVWHTKKKLQTLFVNINLFSFIVLMLNVFWTQLRYAVHVLARLRMCLREKLVYLERILSIMNGFPVKAWGLPPLKIHQIHQTSLLSRTSSKPISMCCAEK